jgi:hypothetical protein
MTFDPFRDRDVRNQRIYDRDHDSVGIVPIILGVALLFAFGYVLFGSFTPTRDTGGRETSIAIDRPATPQPTPKDPATSPLLPR